MSNEFDPYYKWLGIPPKDQPPNHYRLLGIELFEPDDDVIDAAANRLMAYLHDMASGKEAIHSQKLLNEISQARICLLNPDKKSAYDTELRKKLGGADAPIKAAAPPPRVRKKPPSKESGMPKPAPAPPPKVTPLKPGDSRIGAAASASGDSQIPSAPPRAGESRIESAPPPKASPIQPGDSRVGANAAAAAPRAASSVVAATAPGSPPVPLAAAAPHGNANDAEVGIGSSADSSQKNRSLPVLLMGFGGGAAVLAICLIGLIAFWMSGGSDDPPPVPPAPQEKNGLLAFNLPVAMRGDTTLKIDDKIRKLPVDGRTIYKLSPGVHSIQVHRKGFEPIEQTVTVTRGKETEMPLDWKAEASEPEPDVDKIAEPDKYLTKDLIGYWPLDEDLTNRAGNQAPATDTDSFEAAKLRNGLLLTGNERLPIGAISQTTDELTLAGWFRFDEAPAGGALIEMGDAELQVSNGKPLLSIDGVQQLASGPGENPLDSRAGKWFHLAIAYAKGSTSIQYYLDGNSLSSQNIASGATLKLAGPRLGGFKGGVDELRIYARELSPGDIARLAAQTRPALAPPPETRTAGVTLETWNAPGLSFDTKSIDEILLTPPENTETLTEMGFVRNDRDDNRLYRIRGYFFPTVADNYTFSVNCTGKAKIYRRPPNSPVLTEIASVTSGGNGSSPKFAFQPNEPVYLEAVYQSVGAAKSEFQIGVTRDAAGGLAAADVYDQFAAYSAPDDAPVAVVDPMPMPVDPVPTPQVDLFASAPSVLAVPRVASASGAITLLSMTGLNNAAVELKLLGGDEVAGSDGVFAISKNSDPADQKWSIDFKATGGESTNVASISLVDDDLEFEWAAAPLANAGLVRNCLLEVAALDKTHTAPLRESQPLPPILVADKSGKNTGSIALTDIHPSMRIRVEVVGVGGAIDNTENFAPILLTDGEPKDIQLNDAAELALTAKLKLTQDSTDPTTYELESQLMIFGPRNNLLPFSMVRLKPIGESFSVLEAQVASLDKARISQQLSAQERDFAEQQYQKAFATYTAQGNWLNQLSSTVKPDSDVTWQLRVSTTIAGRELEIARSNPVP